MIAGALAALAAGAANQKRGRRKALYPLALGGGEATTHLLKVNRYPARDGWRRRLFGSKARRELRLAEAIAARGIATPIPLAAGEERRGGRVRSCYLLVPFLGGAVDLRRRAAGPLRPAERRALARGFGRFAHAVHAAGVSQEDFQPNNFLVGPHGAEDLWLIDCERLRLRSRLAEDETAWQLAKLVRELPMASLADRARFVSAYAGEDRAERRAVWERVASAQPRLVRHDAERVRRGIRTQGRRFRELELDGWRGVRAEGSALPEIAASLAQLLAAPPGALELAPAGSAFALGFAADSRRAGERRLATAVLLARRGLAPVPLALLQRTRSGILVFRGSLPPRLADLPLRERRAQLPALVGLLARLAGLGRLEVPRAEHIGLAPSGAPLALTLLAPTLFHPEGRAHVASRAAQRALAARILGFGAS